MCLYMPFKAPIVYYFKNYTRNSSNSCSGSYLTLLQTSSREAGLRYCTNSCSIQNAARETASCFSMQQVQIWSISFSLRGFFLSWVDLKQRISRDLLMSSGWEESLKIISRTSFFVRNSQKISKFKYRLNLRSFCRICSSVYEVEFLTF